uniref:Uncharacterized protein n=1 Tax=Acrobeloides nanus TaxID=290746 RepID=A0A914CH45_9BILA
MLLFAILLVILVIVLIVFVCCLLFRTRTEYKKQPFRKKKTRQAATLTHAETPRAFSPIPAAPTHYPTFSPYTSATTFDSPGPIFSTVTTLAPTPRIHGIATISPSTGTTFAPTTSAPTTRPLYSKSASEMRTKPTAAFFTPVTTNGPTTNQPIFTTASIVTLAPSQPVSTTAPNPVPTKRKFGVPTPFTEADTYPLQRSKGIQKTPPLTLNRETQKTPVEVENREPQWTPDSSVKGGNGNGSRKSSGSSQDSSHPIRIPIERLERSEIFV